MRIDSYLGKETAKNLLVFRLGIACSSRFGTAGTLTTSRSLFAESIGVEGRGHFMKLPSLSGRDAESHVHAAGPGGMEPNVPFGRPFAMKNQTPGKV